MKKYIQLGCIFQNIHAQNILAQFQRPLRPFEACLNERATELWKEAPLEHIVVLTLALCILWFSDTVQLLSITQIWHLLSSASVPGFRLCSSPSHWCSCSTCQALTSGFSLLLSLVSLVYGFCLKNHQQCRTTKGIVLCGQDNGRNFSFFIQNFFSCYYMLLPQKKVKIMGVSISFVKKKKEIEVQGINLPKTTELVNGMLTFECRAL